MFWKSNAVYQFCKLHFTWQEAFLHYFKRSKGLGVIEKSEKTADKVASKNALALWKFSSALTDMKSWVWLSRRPGQGYIWQHRLQRSSCRVHVSHPSPPCSLPAGITVLLSLTVFMLLVAEIMPATSDSVPLIGKLIFSALCTMHDASQELFIAYLRTDSFCYYSFAFQQCQE